MNKYQKRRNKVIMHKLPLSKKQVDRIIYDDNLYNDFLQSIEMSKTISKEIIESYALRNGVTMSEERKEAIKNDMEKFFKVWKEIKEKIIEPLCKVINKILKEFEKNIDKLSVKQKIKFGFIKILKPKKYTKVNKPKSIHCRSNC